ncbi:hypothetical protein B0H21DRAFT_892726 [Amylocystis lapponica]|nr:hypothetical protein B0H21DRAFT_892726 [Amylocystis lapponica]
MGLSARKPKQRIPADPRNLAWANDANKFGNAYMQRLGWRPAAGLGPAGAGRTTHVAVHQKLDVLGIGAGRRAGAAAEADGAQSGEFEALLLRLNAQGASAAGAGGTEKARKRQRKHAGGSGEDAKRARRDKTKGRGRGAAAPSPRTPSPPAEEIVSNAPAPRPLRAHRARHIASKGLASKSAAAVSEILGVAPAPTSAPSHPSASASPYPPEPEVVLQELTTSSKSVMDYFREKLAAKSSSRVSAAPSEPATPTEAARESDGEEARPRLGLGSARLQAVVQASAAVEPAATEDEQQRDARRKRKQERREARAAGETPRRRTRGRRGVAEKKEARRCGVRCRPSYRSTVSAMAPVPPG